MFKLEGDAHARALELAGAELFDPSGMGRPMKQWVVVPRAHMKRWTELARSAVGSGATARTPPTRPKRSKSRG